MRLLMQFDEIKKYKESIYRIAAQHGIIKVYVFGSVARGESNVASDVDFLIEMENNASALGVGGFQYEVQQLLGIHIDVIPTFVFPRIDDREFVRNIASEAIAL